MTADSRLPEDLASLPPAERAALTLISVRLEPAILGEIEQLLERLRRPTRAALIRCLLLRGLRSVQEVLDRLGGTGADVACQQLGLQPTEPPSSQA